MSRWSKPRHYRRYTMSCNFVSKNTTTNITRLVIDFINLLIVVSPVPRFIVGKCSCFVFPVVSSSIFLNHLKSNITNPNPGLT